MGLYAVKSTRPPGSPTSWELDEIRNKIAARYNRGLNDHEIAREVGISDKTVYRWRKARGLQHNFSVKDNPK